MISRASDEISHALLRANECERNASDLRIDAVLRHDYEHIAKSWRALAASFDVAVRISGYLEWQARRVAPPPDFVWRD